MKKKISLLLLLALLLANFTQAQKSLASNLNGLEFSDMAVLKQQTQEAILQGNDDRIRIGNPMQYPWTTICKVKATFPDGSVSEGTGTMFCKNGVLTAAHVVYNTLNRSRADFIEVYPAYEQGASAFGSAEVSRSWIYPDYKVNLTDGLDVAFLELATNLGERTGWMGLLADSEIDLESSAVFMAGYPGDLDDGEQMYFGFGDISDASDGEVFHSVDTYNGMSGAGIFRRYNGGMYIVGVHTGGAAGYSNWGVRIKPFMIDWVLATFFNK